MKCSEVIYRGKTVFLLVLSRSTLVSNTSSQQSLTRRNVSTFWIVIRLITCMAMSSHSATREGTATGAIVFTKSMKEICLSTFSWQEPVARTLVPCMKNYFSLFLSFFLSIYLSIYIYILMYMYLFPPQCCKYKPSSATAWGLLNAKRKDFAGSYQSGEGFGTSAYTYKHGWKGVP